MTHRCPYENVAVLYDHRCIAEDEIDGAVDVTVSVELAKGVDVESVLVCFDAASVEH